LCWGRKDKGCGADGAPRSAYHRGAARRGYARAISAGGVWPLIDRAPEGGAGAARGIVLERRAQLLLSGASLCRAPWTARRLRPRDRATNRKLSQSLDERCGESRFRANLRAARGLAK